MNTARRVSTDDKYYEHTQHAPAATWVIVHNLGKKPAVYVEDSAGTSVIGDLDHDSDNQLTLQFSAAFSGKAFLN